MRRLAAIGLAVLLAGGWVSAPAFAEVASTEQATTGLSSNKDRGSVTLNVEPVLDKGRLVFKVTGFNRTDQPVPLTDRDIKVFTAGGRQVGLISLDRLISEARPKHHRTLDPESDDPFGDDRMGTQDRRARDPLGTGSSRGVSRPDDMGSDSPLGGGVSTRQSQSPTESSVSVSAENPAQRAHVEALKSAILQSKIVQPQASDGGQLVTEKLRSSKGDRALRVVVNFAGEAHEFNFEPPGN